MKKEDIKPGAKVRRIGTEFPIYKINSKEEHEYYYQYPLTIFNDEHEYTAFGIAYATEAELVSSYELVEKYKEYIFSDSIKTEKQKMDIDPTYITSIEESKELMGLNVNEILDASDYYYCAHDGEYFIYYGKTSNPSNIKAWSINALKSVLPKSIESNGQNCHIDIEYVLKYYTGKNEEEDETLSHSCIYKSERELKSGLVQIIKGANKPRRFQPGDLIILLRPANNFDFIKNKILEIDSIFNQTAYIARLYNSENKETITIPVSCEDLFNKISINI